MFEKSSIPDMHVMYVYNFQFLVIVTSMNVSCNNIMLIFDISSFFGSMYNDAINVTNRKYKLNSLPNVLTVEVLS